MRNKLLVAAMVGGASLLGLGAHTVAPIGHILTAFTPPARGVSWFPWHGWHHWHHRHDWDRYYG